MAVLTVTFMPPALVWWLIVHPFAAFWRRVGSRLTLTLLTVGSVTCIVALMRIRDALVLSDFGTRWPLVAAAAVLVGLSWWIAVLRKKHLTFRILAGVPELEGESGELLQEGIYGRIRHPRYVEIALGTLGAAVFANYAGAYVVALATLPLLHLIVVFEERELLHRFGAAYAEYAEGVPRYLPRRPAR